MSARPPEPINPDGYDKRFQLLVDAVTDYAIYMMDADGIVASWNSGAERLKGYSAAEIIGQPYAQFFLPADRDTAMPQHILAEAKRLGRFESEGWRLRKDGTTFWALAVVHAITDSTGRHIGYAKVTRDMTERRAAQLALVDSEQRFRLLVNNVVDYAICMLEPGGVVAEWNAGAERIAGYRAAEIIGQHFSRFYPWDDRVAGLPARVLDIAARDGRYEAEGWRIRKDGTRFWAAVVIDAIRDDDGRLVGFAEITRDITERREAQEALRESERQFRLLMNSVTDYAVFRLDLNGLVASWNAGAERIKGYRAGEIIGQHFSRFYTESERSAGIPAGTLLTAATQGRSDVEGLRVRKDGTVFWAHVVIDPIRDEQGSIVGFAKITRDITERRAAQQLLQDAQMRLAQAQKMEALGQVTGGVAHDFNNLLMVIGGFGHILRERLAGDQKGLRAAAAIEHAARRGEALTRQLLSFSRRQNLRPTMLDLHVLIETIRPVLASTIGGRYRLAETIAADVWLVRLDANELEMALINLAANARDAMGQGGLVTLTAENITVARGSVAADIAGDFVALSVADTGSGIAPEMLSLVFDPFFTTKAVGQGTGLGLSQVHGFAYQSGGAVTITSEPGRGTCVTLYLPRAVGEPAAIRKVTATGGVALGCLVLLVEDNPEVAQATLALLGSIGCHAVVAPDGAAASRMLETRRFDLVLSDIVMPGAMNGLDLARAVRGRHPTTPVLLATGYSAAVAEAAAEFLVLCKPYSQTQLGEAVAALTGRAAAGNVVALRDGRQARS